MHGESLVTGVAAPAPRRAGLAAFAGEAAAWRGVGGGWRQLFGNFQDAGLSFEWHDFESGGPFDWHASFHPNSVELCLNIEGEGRISQGKAGTVVGPRMAVFYCQAKQALEAFRAPGQRHQFLTLEFSFGFLKHELKGLSASLHPLVKQVVENRGRHSGVTQASHLTSRQQQILQSLREPPVLAAAQGLWYRTKALELAAEFFFRLPDGEELFCQRQKRLAAERVEKVIALLRRDLANPPPLEEIGRLVGCSPFHLSRTFSKTAGMTLPQYIRQLRMERAAELLRSGKRNVTEAAFEVGYSSLSHFSQAFHQTFGCCPGLYPLKIPIPSGLGS